MRRVYRGPLSYAAAPIEGVDWTGFDFVCLDYYCARRNRFDYGRRLRPHFAHGKPVVITELGCCAYRGAQDKGAMGWGIVDPRDHDRLSGDVDGAFVFTFSAPALPHRPQDPRRDLDMASYAVVKSYDDGRWEPKRLFHALAAHYA